MTRTIAVVLAIAALGYVLWRVAPLASMIVIALLAIASSAFISDFRKYVRQRRGK